MDLLSKISDSMDGFSKRQKQIGQYILSNYDKAAFSTASRLGQAVGVSESTVVRFAYALGYEGYPQLQKALQEVIRNKLTSVQRIQLSSDLNEQDVINSVLKSDMQNIRSTMENVDRESFERTVSLIAGARTVYILGQRSSTPLAMFLGYYLQFVLADVKTIVSGMQEVMEQLIRIGADDVCIGISFPRYSSRTLEGLRYAKDKGARLVAITDSSASPLMPVCDECLLARSDMASFADSLVAPLSLINALIVAVGLKNRGDAESRLLQLESVWDKYMTYVSRERI